MGDNNEYGDSDFLAERDKTVHDFRASDKETKHKIIEKMLTLRHNMKYNKHLLSVYMRAKGIFDTMVDEHRSQVEHLDEIYRHLNNLIRENLSAQRNKPVDASSKLMMAELVKDKKRMGGLLKKMRASFDKLMDIDTVIGVTIDQINKITFMEDHTEAKAEDSEHEDDEPEDEPEDSEPEDERDSDSDSDSEDDDDSDSESEPEDDSESESDSEPEDEDDDESEPEDESEDDSDSDSDSEEDVPEDDSDSEDDEPEDEPEDEEDEHGDAKKPVIYLF